MRLKRLEMVGFKSFAEKTRVDFEPGITAIIGPNGCGKSNISDSIRWALGEMSSRALRSQQMLDVIFNGTANRPAHGMSEVALTFDNTEGRLPIDYTEVTVSRRLFRSGESEYYINKTQCRLKDIRDLFMDTGIGNDGYYVMAQGKIEFILSAKPEERRELFEEAAGVSRYKARREETIRRLDKVEQDMLRLNDSLAIYKQQMETLETAVRKARTHQKLQDELKNLEIAALLEGIKGSTTSLETFVARREEETTRLAALREELSANEGALVASRTEAETVESAVTQLQSQVAQADADWVKAETERGAAAERTIELRNEQARLELEIGRMSSTIEQLRQRQGEWANEVQALQQQFDEKNERFALENEKALRSQESLVTLQKDLEKAKARLMELARLISQHRNETVRLTSLSIRNEEATKAKLREREKVELRRGVLDEQINGQESQAKETENRLAQVELAMKNLAEAQQRDEEKRLDLEQTIQSLRERQARLEAEKVSMQRWLSQDPIALGSTALRQAGLPGIFGPVSMLFQTAEPYQRLLDRGLGDRAEYFVADTLNDAQAAVRYLSDEQKGWATFIILNRLTDAQSKVLWEEHLGTRSLAEAVHCDERFRPVLAHLLGRTYFVGATLFEESLVKGGSDPMMVDGFQATPAELHRLTQELETIGQTLQSTREAHETIKAAILTRENERKPLQDELSRIHVTYQVQQDTLRRLRADRDNADAEARIVGREHEELTRAIAEAQHRLGEEEVLLTTLEEEDATLQENFRTQDAQLQSQRQEAQTQQIVVSQLRLDAETTRERLLGKQKEEANGRREMESLEQRLALDRQQTESNTARLSQLEILQTEKAALLQTLSEQRTTFRESLTSQTQRKQEIQSILHRQEQTIASQREALASAVAHSQEAEFQARTLEAERVRLQTQLQDQYQLSVEDATTTYGTITANAEELARLRRRLESLGAVNLAAPEEHAQLEERYGFLSTQQQDLLKAKEDLMQAIQKINATTREQFKTTFIQVRQNFKELYQTLFQGGEADLVLTDEQNVLESGVEIMAQPPGKKLQNIALLSGGEKALTATALLFAFFMVKPSPFCLLDEVDAPLDEANVSRFVKMVQTFSDKTQFIVITHNKRTMEMADIMYGVTMAELGISSLLSMKLENTKPTEPVAV